MTKHALLLGISLAALTLYCLPAAAQATSSEDDSDGVVLPTIDVNALAEASPYSMTSAASTTSAGIVQLKAGGDAKTALRSMAGVFTMSPSDQPALQANIRGLEGFGRVNNMIDGVPQTFRNIAGHGAGNAGLTYVDPTLLAGIEVQRGAVSGAHGSGALAGSANYRTLDVDDVVREGKEVGLLVKSSFGSNGKSSSQMISAASRHDILDTGSIGFIGALSMSNFGLYKNGDGDTPTSINTENSPLSGLAKVEFAPNDEQLLKLGGRWYDNTFTNGGYEWNVTNSTYTADYSYNPGSELIDFNAHAYLNDTDFAYTTTTGGGYRFRESNNTTWGVNADNTSRFALGNGVGLEAFYGASWSSDTFEINAYKSGNAPGEHLKGSVFTDLTASWDIFSLTGGLRYDSWSVEGYQPPYAAGTGDCPAGGAACGDEIVSRDGGDLNPKLTAAVQPLDWLQLYATYAHTSRSPSVQEMLFPGVPFTTGVGSGVVNNLNLVPETSRGWDIGANIVSKGLLFDDDSLELKVGYFDKAIENFIVNDFVEITGVSGTRAMYVNRPGETRMRGIELEGSYDAGFAYVNLAYTLADTEQPVGDGAGWGNGVTGTLPENYFTLDLGTRWLDDRSLTIGGIVRYVGEGTQANGMGETLDTEAYTLVDLYASWELSEFATVFASVENVLDTTYTPANSMEFSDYSVPTGRGRTVVVGANLRF